MSWRNRPPLKSGIDLQLQSAFNSDQWAVVIRLAEKRFQTSKDQYFEILKICAAGQLDSQTDKASCIVALDKLVREGTVIKDVDAIDLLEWAVGDLQDERRFSDTLGVLKTRLVKSSSKDRNAGVRCLESCLLHWDLVNAQQIAAILDRSFSRDRVFFFWNVVITYLLSRSDQCPPDKRSLYGMLALKQIQRASQSAASPTASADSDRSVKGEEEVLLLFRILETNASEAEWDAALDHPLFGPLPQLKLGRKDLLLRVLEVSADRGHWNRVYALCKGSLTLSQLDQTQPSLIACDWSVWSAFLTSARHASASHPEVQEEVSSVLNAFLSAPLPPIYQRNLLLAKVLFVFTLEQGDPSSCRSALERYVDSQCSSPACFDDIKVYAEQLNIEELTTLAHDYIPKLALTMEDPLHVASVKTLAYKLQYLALTLPHPLFHAAESGSGTDAAERPSIGLGAIHGSPSSQEQRFQSLAESTTALYAVVIDSLGARIDQDPDCVPELAILAATSLVKLSGFDGTKAISSSSPLPPTASDYRRLLQAALILENQLTRTPKHSRATLLIVRIYIALGCITRATELWDTMDVKRTIVESMSPYFLDRLSTLSPDTVLPSQGKPSQALTYGIKSYYKASLKLRMHGRFADAFESESYTSILEIPTYVERLRASCTMVMGYLEEMRASRALGYRTLPVSEEAHLSDLNPDVPLKSVVDYGSVPHFEASSAEPIYNILQRGPEPSSARMHLGLITERFFEILSHKPPATYKPSSIQQAAAVEKEFVVESLQQLNTSASRFLRASRGLLTAEEESFYQLVTLLIGAIPLAADGNRSTESEAALIALCGVVSQALDSLRICALSLPSDGQTPVPLVMIGSTHAMFFLRDAAAIIRLAVNYATPFLEKNGQMTPSAKQVTSAMKMLLASASGAVADGQERIGLMKKEFGAHTLVDKVVAWTFAGQGDDRLNKQIRDLTGDGMRDWALNVAGSWRANAKCWAMVRWD